MMKKILVISIGIVFSLFLTCERNGTTPTCIDGIQNGNETGIDCGGDCDACFECTTNNCILLSGVTSSEPVTNKKWIYVDEGKYKPDYDLTLEYYSNGKVIATLYGETGRGTWKFDNPSSPKAIIEIYGEEGIPSSWTPGERIFPLVVLTADSLRMEHARIKDFFMLLIPE
jgi:hypothetical protein